MTTLLRFRRFSPSPLTIGLSGPRRAAPDARRDSPGPPHARASQSGTGDVNPPPLLRDSLSSSNPLREPAIRSGAPPQQRSRMAHAVYYYVVVETSPARVTDPHCFFAFIMCASRPTKPRDKGVCTTRWCYLSTHRNELPIKFCAKRPVRASGSIRLWLRT